MLLKARKNSGFLKPARIKFHSFQITGFDMTSINYAHCLRRRFTENILTHLLEGTSVNVVVRKRDQEDQEADRLLADVEGCDLPNARVLAVNMRACRGSYRQFLLDLWQQSHHQPALECSDLFTILGELEQAEQQFIIVLNHLDAMRANDVDVQFDQDFYIHLNSLKNYHNVALLVITEGTSYHGMSFNIGGEFKTSKLDIQEIEYLPALMGDEGRYELTQRHPELSTVHISHLLEQGQHQELGYDYALLDYLSRQLRHSVESWDDMARFIQQLKDWQKRYKRQSKQAEYRAQKVVEAAGKSLSIFKMKHLFSMGYDILKTVFLEWPIVLMEKISEYKKRKE
ncbi:MAG: hypothetical protein DRR16_22590 [Candidatus Parabeggiatoa sp. nov. 3]|nr:MAG: hypothetical protein DRR00_25190 [Gammaproteobacteria bacterium]RKZ81146.1 MAG: hypothetical protein DRR16_22590 [Gammaproteobacteria bacterium]